MKSFLTHLFRDVPIVHARLTNYGSVVNILNKLLKYK